MKQGTNVLKLQPPQNAAQVVCLAKTPERVWQGGYKALLVQQPLTKDKRNDKSQTKKHFGAELRTSMPTSLSIGTM